MHRCACMPKSAAPRPTLPCHGAEFDDVLRFRRRPAATPFPALRALPQALPRLQKARRPHHVRARCTARQARMNIGTIVEAPLLQACNSPGRVRFSAWVKWKKASPTCCGEGDTFMFAGRLLRFITHSRETTIECAEDGGTGDSRRCPPMPARACALTTNLAARVRAMLQRPRRAGTLYPDPKCANGWQLQYEALRASRAGRSAGRSRFRGDGRWYTVAYCLRRPQRAPDARACCSPAAWNAWRDAGRSASSPPITCSACGPPTNHTTSPGIIRSRHDGR